MTNHLLNAYPLIRTQNTEELEGVVAQTYGPARLNINRRSEKFDVVANHCQLQSIGLTYGHHGAPIEITFPNFDLFAQLFSLGGTAEATLGRAKVAVGKNRTFVASPSDLLHLR